MSGDSERLYTRIEAAAWLTHHGINVLPQTMAGWVSKGIGPTVMHRPSKSGGRPRAAYKESDLAAWLADHPKGMARHGGPRVTDATFAMVERPNGRLGIHEPARVVISDFLAVADRMTDGTGTFHDGVRYAQGLERLRGLLKE